MKTCKTCSIAKELSCFSAAKSNADGLRNVCRECNRAYMAAYYAANRDEAGVKAKEYRAVNAEAVAKTRRAHHEKNREKNLENMKRWRTSNPEKFRADIKRWEEENPERVRASRQNTRAKRRAAPGRHTAQDIARIFSLQRGLCAACRRSIKHSYHVDHRVALARGGSNDAHNLQLLCPHCNLSKSAKDPIKFMQERGFLL